MRGSQRRASAASALPGWIVDWRNRLQDPLGAEHKVVMNQIPIAAFRRLPEDHFAQGIREDGNPQLMAWLLKPCGHKGSDELCNYCQAYSLHFSEPRVEWEAEGGCSPWDRVLSHHTMCIFPKSCVLFSSRMLKHATSTMQKGLLTDCAIASATVRGAITGGRIRVLGRPTCVWICGSKILRKLLSAYIKEE
jgi:hypothetical protein